MVRQAISRKSTTSWSDCIATQRKIAELQESMMQYLAAGCPPTGLNDDHWVIINAMYLRDKLNELINKHNDINRKNTESVADAAVVGGVSPPAVSQGPD